MSRQNYSDEQLDFLRLARPLRRLPELTRLFNRIFKQTKTESQIKSALANHRIKSGRRTGNEKGCYRLFTREQARWIRRVYRELDCRQLAAAFNGRFGTAFTVGQFRTFVHNHGIDSGRTGRFEKGNRSWNKGTKGVMQPNSGNFKKGSVPANTKPLGHERICSKDGYILVKIRERNPYTGAATRYKAKHVVTWEAAHGPVPAGFIIRFRNGDKCDCSLGNLEMISLAENARLNQLHYNEMPHELQPAVRTLARIAAKRGELIRGMEK